MLQVAVCDDEKCIRDDIARLANSFFARESVDAAVQTFSDGNALLRHKGRIDIIFLDIMMPESDGMETAKKLRDAGFTGILIFVTVLRELVFRAFEVQAFDYLIKPIEPEAFDKTMTRLMRQLENAEDKALLIRHRSDTLIVPFDDILYCEVIDRKIYLHLRSGSTVEYYEKIENLEKKLAGSFYRCHRSYLVNLKYVTGQADGAVLLEGDRKVPLSRLRAKEFASVIFQYLRGKGA